MEQRRPSPIVEGDLPKSASRAFPRTARLRSAAEFSRVFQQSRPLHARHLVLRHRVASDDVATARLGMAISRRHARRAVDRNRVKRLLRESFRQWADRHGPIDLVVLSKAGIDQVENEILRAEMQMLLGRLS